MKQFFSSQTSLELRILSSSECDHQAMQFSCFLYFDKFYDLIYNVLVTLCHRLPLLLYRQVMSCWFDQQRTLSLKPNARICVVQVSLSTVGICSSLYMYTYKCVFTPFTFSGNFLLVFGNTKFSMYYICWDFVIDTSNVD